MQPAPGRGGGVNTSTPESMTDVSRTIEERCRALRLPVWSWAAGDAAVKEASGWGDADRWLRAPMLRDRMCQVRAAWPRDDPPPVVELFPGCWLMPLVERADDGETHITVPMALGVEAFESAAFTEICRSAGVVPDHARVALCRVACFRREDADGHARMLRWMIADIASAAQHRHAIANMSEQLVDLYEHMNLLYRVGELMNGLEDPQGFVRVSCDLLQSTLAFGWIAVRFTSLPSLGPTLANDLIMAGSVPCSHTRYDRLAGEAAWSARTTDDPRVQTVDSSDLARLVNAEVFINPLICDDEVAGVLLAGNKRGGDPAISTVDMQLISATADYLSAYIHNASMYNEQRTTFLGIIKALSASIDAKDEYTRGHSERVAHLATELARAIGMSDEQAERVRLSGILHDMGKIGVPEAVLSKPGRLTDEEFAKIKKHPEIGYNILKDIEPLQDVLPGVLHHHERWDGRGYPHGLREQHGEHRDALGVTAGVAILGVDRGADGAERAEEHRLLVVVEGGVLEEDDEVLRGGVDEFHIDARDGAVFAVLFAGEEAADERAVAIERVDEQLSGAAEEFGVSA